MFFKVLITDILVGDDTVRVFLAVASEPVGPYTRCGEMTLTIPEAHALKRKVEA
jgi:hypothetical protein